MTALNLPAGTHITATTLAAVSPGQTRITYAYSGVVDTLSRSPTMWSGTLTMLTEQGRERDFLVFAQAMNGQAGTFRFPLVPVESYAPQAHATNKTDVRDYRITAVNDTDGTLTTRPLLLGDGRNTNWTPTINDFINIGNRLVRVVEAPVPQSPNNTMIRVAPRVGAVGDDINVRQPFVVARLDGQSQFSLGVGPASNTVQSVTWIEALEF